MKFFTFYFCILLLLPQFTVAEDQSSTPSSTKGPVYGVYFDQGNAGAFIVVSGLKPCVISGANLICGKEEDDSWVGGKTVYLNPAKIQSVYEFSSLEDYKASVQKYNNSQSNGIVNKLLGK